MELMMLRRLFFVLLLAGAGTAAWRFGPNVLASLDRPPSVPVIELSRQDVQLVLAVTGRIRPRQQNQVAPIVRGRIVALEAEEGDTIAQGDVLARLDARTLSADIDEAIARLREAEDRVEFAQSELARLENLAASGTTSDSQYEQARLDLQVNRRAVTALRKRKESLEARKEDLVLRSPLNGVVLQRPVDCGQVVGPGDFVYLVATETEALVEAEVDERFLTKVEIGQKARVVQAGQTLPQYEVTLTYIGRSIDRLSGAIPVRFSFVGEDPILPIGLTLDVNLEVARHPGALTAPRDAIQDVDGDAWVFGIEPTNEPDAFNTVRIPVVLEDWSSQSVVVLDGLTPGDWILAEPEGVEENERVRIEGATSDG